MRKTGTLVLLVLGLWAATPSAQSKALGSHKTAVVLLNWTDATLPATLTAASAKASFGNIAAWFTGQSFGAFTFAPVDVYGPLTMPVALNGQCGNAGPRTYAIPVLVQQIGQAAWDSYLHRVWVSRANCNANSSVGVIPSDTMVFNDVGSVLRHELGHALGLMHIADRWDVMEPGAGGVTFGPQAKSVFGWIDTAGQPTSQLVTTSGRYTIEGWDGAGRGVKALRVRVATSSGFVRSYDYWVSTMWRDSVSSRVFVHQGAELADLDPGSAVDYDLSTGQTWTSPLGAMSIRTVSTTGNSATVDVTFGAAPVVVAQTPNDPIVFGTNGADTVRGVAVDGQGYRYITGGQSIDQACASGQTGNCDTYLRIEDPAGNQVCTNRVGGPGYDRNYAVSVWNGRIFTGGRAGPNFPITQGNAFGGDVTERPLYGPQDGLFMEWNAACQVVRALYVGSTGSEIVRDLKAHASGVYLGMAVVTRTGWFVANAPIKGAVDGALVALTHDGAFRWGVLEGGAAEVAGAGINADGGNPSIAVNDTGVVHLTGAASTDIALTAGAAKTVLGGQRDLLVIKRTLDGALVWRTLAGGPGNEGLETHHVAYLPDHRVAVSFYALAGLTVSPGAVGPQACGGNDSALVVISADGTRFDATTYICGSTTLDWPEGLAVLPDGRIVFTGMSDGAFPAGYAATGSRDPFLLVLPATLDRIDYAYRWVGGSAIDDIHDTAVLPDGRVIVVGDTTSTDFFGAGALAGDDGWRAVVTIPPPPSPSPCVLDPLVPIVSVTATGHTVTWAGSITATDERNCVGQVNQ